MDVKPGYKMTEVGVIPEDWDVLSLGILFSFKNGLNKGKEFFGHGKLIVNYMDVYGHSGLRCADIEGRVDVSRDELDAFNVRRGDVFFTRTSETVDEVGIPSVLLDDSDETVFSGFILRARPKNDALVDQFKRYCFLSRVVRNQIISKSTYTTRALTNGRVLSGIKLPTPKIKAEQSAIATALSDTDALIESLEKLIAKKRQIKQGAMQELLTGKRRLPGFTGEWEVRRLGDVATLCRENVIPASSPLEMFIHYSLPAYDLGKVPVVEPGSEIGSNKFRVPRDAILVSKLNPRIPRVWAPDSVPVNAISSTEFLVLQPNKNVSRPFLYVVCSSSKFCEQMELSVTGTTGSHQRVNPGDALNIELPVPSSMQEQSAIATILSDMDAELSVFDAKLTKARAIKQGMMRELLTGRIRLVEPKDKVREAPC